MGSESLFVWQYETVVGEWGLPFRAGVL